MQVTRRLPSAGAPLPRRRDSSNAARITRSEARRVITRRSVARSAVRSAMPEYRPSVFLADDHHVDVLGRPHLAERARQAVPGAAQAAHRRMFA